MTLFSKDYLSSTNNYMSYYFSINLFKSYSTEENLFFNCLMEHLSYLHSCLRCADSWVFHQN